MSFASLSYLAYQVNSYLASSNQVPTNCMGAKQYYDHCIEHNYQNTFELQDAGTWFSSLFDGLRMHQRCTELPVEQKNWEAFTECYYSVNPNYVFVATTLASAALGAYLLTKCFQAKAQQTPRNV